MRTIPKRKIMRSLCKSYKTSEGRVFWSKVANELLKLDYFKKQMAELEKGRANK